MKKSEYILAKVCGIICVIGGFVAFILFAVKGVPHIMSLLFAVSMFFLGIALLLVTPKPTIPRTTEERLHEEEKHAELKRIVEERKGKEAVDYDKMLIAHYDIGNVKDPLGVVHDESGEPILLNAERIMGRTDEVKAWLCKTRHSNTWKIFGGKFLFEDAGRGTLYRTNKRLIYIRDPNPPAHLVTYGPLGVPGQSGAVLNAKEWAEKGRKECVALPLENIHNITYRRKGVVLKVEESSQDRYVVSLYGESSIPKLIIGTTTQSTADLIDVKCPYCQSTFQITLTKRPFKVKCPSCGKKSLLK